MKLYFQSYLLKKIANFSIQNSKIKISFDANITCGHFCAGQLKMHFSVWEKYRKLIQPYWEMYNSKECIFVHFQDFIEDSIFLAFILYWRKKFDEMFGNVYGFTIENVFLLLKYSDPRAGAIETRQGPYFKIYFKHNQKAKISEQNQCYCEIV